MFWLGSCPSIKLSIEKLTGGNPVIGDGIGEGPSGIFASFFLTGIFGTLRPTCKKVAFPVKASYSRSIVTNIWEDDDIPTVSLKLGTSTPPSSATSELRRVTLLEP